MHEDTSHPANLDFLDTDEFPEFGDIRAPALLSAY
jgi:hypothetical protein